MIAGVADTHAALWYLLKNPLLSPAARRFMDDAAAAGLVEKNRLPLPPITISKTRWPIPIT